ncbi:MAG: PLP-dependent transferase [Oscillospiraceae bacterium]
MRVETQCIHEGYTPKNGETRVLPIYQSTTYKYDSTEHVGKLFDLSVEGHMYSRISNPTVEAVEKKIAAMEGGVGALCTTSGQAASLISLLNILGSGDHFISVSAIYGGTVNLFAVTLKKLGVECTFVDGEATERKYRPASAKTPRPSLAKPSPIPQFPCWTLKNLRAWRIKTACR